MTRDKQLLPPFAKDLPSVLSKIVALGMPFPAALHAVTDTPRRVMGMEPGGFAPGSPADLAIFRVETRGHTVRDSAGEAFPMRRLPVPKLTMLNGSVVFWDGGFSN